MLSTYKERILREIERVPESKMPKLYRVIHLLATELMPETKKAAKRGSLKGIWKGAQIDESLFIEAKKSLFPYEYR
jgi:mRNA-degrading endonuclease YafQ of YafQ-DinJ toxin-antitoxin module